MSEWKHLEVLLTWSYLDCRCGAKRAVLEICVTCGDTRTEPDDYVTMREQRFEWIDRLISAPLPAGIPVEIDDFIARFDNTFERFISAAPGAPTDERDLDQLKRVVREYREIAAGARAASDPRLRAEWARLEPRSLALFRAYRSVVTAVGPDSAAVAADDLSEALSGVVSSLDVLRFNAEPRLTVTPDEAEEMAADWMRSAGFRDVMLTPKTGDGGIDVSSREAVAQVKAQAKSVGRPDVQRLHGVATIDGRQAVFFSLSGYSPQALAWANRAGTALLTFDEHANIRGANPAGRRLARLSPTRIAPAADPSWVWACMLLGTMFAAAGIIASFQAFVIVGGLLLMAGTLAWVASRDGD